MTEARRITPTSALAVQQLELDGDALVTVDRLGEVMKQTGHFVSDDRQVRQFAYKLQRQGWFGQLRTRDVWEFLSTLR